MLALRAPRALCVRAYGAPILRALRADAAADKAAAARTLGNILYMYRLRLAGSHHGLLQVRNHGNQLGVILLRTS